MRRFEDRDGAQWDVVAGRESWGILVALFIPSASGGEVRQANLSAPSYDQAVVELDRLTETALQEMLDVSRPKPK